MITLFETLGETRAFVDCCEDTLLFSKGLTDIAEDSPPPSPPTTTTMGRSLPRSMVHSLSSSDSEDDYSEESSTTSTAATTESIATVIGENNNNNNEEEEEEVPASEPTTKRLLKSSSLPTSSTEGQLTQSRAPATFRFTFGDRALITAQQPPSRPQQQTQPPKQHRPLHRSSTCVPCPVGGSTVDNWPTSGRKQQQRRSILKTDNPSTADDGGVTRRRVSPTKSVSFEEGALWFHFDGAEDDRLLLESRPLVSPDTSTSYDSGVWRSPSTNVTFVFGPTSTIPQRRPLHWISSNEPDDCPPALIQSPSSSSNCRNVDGFDSPVSSVDNQFPMSSRLAVQPETKFTVVEGSGEQTGRSRLLKFSVPLGVSGLNANDILVRSNSAGNSLRVQVRSRSPAFSLDASYALPVVVDPYSVRARIDSVGKLFLEAAVTDNKIDVDGTTSDV